MNKYIQVKGKIAYLIRKLERIFFFRFPLLQIIRIRCIVKRRLIFTKRISEMEIIIIGGAPRSGTTLFRSLLSAHPDIAAPQNEYSVVPSKTKRRIRKDSALMGLIKHIRPIKAAKDPVELTEITLNIIKTQQNKKYAAVKAPRHNLFIDIIFNHYPKCRYIHVLRDGRDTACSLRHFPKNEMVNGKLVSIEANNPFSGCVKRWKYYIESGVKWRGHKNYFEVRYEDLVSDPQKIMDGVCKHLKIDPISGDRLSGQYSKEKVESSPHTAEVASRLFNTSVGKWEKEMTGREKDIFKEITGDLLISLGYVKDNNW